MIPDVVQVEWFCAACLVAIGFAVGAAVCHRRLMVEKKINLLHEGTIKRLAKATALQNESNDRLLAALDRSSQQTNRSQGMCDELISNLQRLVVVVEKMKNGGQWNADDSCGGGTDDLPAQT